MRTGLSLLLVVLLFHRLIRRWQIEGAFLAAGAEQVAAAKHGDYQPQEISRPTGHSNAQQLKGKEKRDGIITQVSALVVMAGMVNVEL
ncbi:MAG: hypothetical protein OI74_06780 [Gammaproteobacteria bacterium (ex Lamellibrachia satsuma)]|nr:MAG: hypothetical protein OI74_06780 [Gammaproteobacteria bacterium (ex Lamellibrachia satsuma)]RRS37554.1 MAG: hypothetical protein NV67_00410 [Gammaproteobacteria bacterium (ex Lamellibrachia satsuma)]